MELDIKIGPYSLQKRTEYSKFQIFDGYGANITNTSTGEIMIRDYESQTKEPDKYFTIKDDILVSFNSEEARGMECIFVPEGVVGIERCVFESASMFYVHIPKSVAIIGDYAFAGCHNLEGINIPEAVSIISYGSFMNCYNLKKLDFPMELKKIEDKAFLGCRGLRRVKLPDTLKNISNYAFKDCINLEEVLLGDGIRILDHGVFDGCIGLKNIKLPENLQIMRSNCFSECISLKEIVVPNDISILHEKTFADCRSLESAILPDGVVAISSGLFSNCESLESLNLPDTVQIISEDAFIGTKQLKKINIPRDLNTISNAPFAGSKIKALKFNYDLANNILKNVSLLEGSEIDKLIIDNSVREISANPFRKCGGYIKTINYLGTKEEFEDFKRNNKRLFDVLPNLEKVNFLTRSIDDPNRDIEK